MSGSENNQNGQEKGAAGPYKGLFVIVLFAACIGVYLSLVIGWVVFPKVLYSSQKQPFNFSHATHIGVVDDGCKSCHAFREDGGFVGIPNLENCMQCHTDMQGEDPNEKILVEEYVKNNKEIPWLVYSKQPDCVFFSHAAHVFSDKFQPQTDDYAQKCKVCHGPVAESDTCRVYQENRLTGQSVDIWGRNISGIKVNSWDRMKMDDCAECHAKTKADELHGKKEACFVCHK